MSETITQMIDGCKWTLEILTFYWPVKHLTFKTIQLHHRLQTLEYRVQAGDWLRKHFNRTRLPPACSRSVSLCLTIMLSLGVSAVVLTYSIFGIKFSAAKMSKLQTLGSPYRQKQRVFAHCTRLSAWARNHVSSVTAKSESLSAKSL